MIEAGGTTKQQAGKRRDQHLSRRRETRGGRVDSRPVNLAGSGGSHDAAVAACGAQQPTAVKCASWGVELAMTANVSRERVDNSLAVEVHVLAFQDATWDG
jgi:hypothetical protein